MNEKGKQLFSLMFRPGETVCVSHNKYGYHSIPLENALDGPVTLVSPDPERAYEHPGSDDLTMVALNPIEGWRRDEFCTAYRNFLVELDVGELKDQLIYAEKIGLPYSAAIFSGNKSLHFLISLDQDLPSEDVYRKLSCWMLNIATLADQNTQNPSRSIRIPGAYREPGKKQRMVKFLGPTKALDLIKWLREHPDEEPKVHEKREILDGFDLSKVTPWARKRLQRGLDSTKGRNKQWFALACELALSGYEEDVIFKILGHYFVPDRDFKEKEWKTAIASGIKHAYGK